MAQSYAGMSVTFGWLSNTFPSPPAKRAVALAFINSVSQLGNVSGSCVSFLHLFGVLTSPCRYVWQPVWGPTFRNSFVICIMAAASAISMSYILKLRLTAMNKKLRREEVARGDTIQGFRYLI